MQGVDLIVHVQFFFVRCLHAPNFCWSYFLGHPSVNKHGNRGGRESDEQRQERKKDQGRRMLLSSYLGRERDQLAGDRTTKKKAGSIRVVLVLVEWAQHSSTVGNKFYFYFEVQPWEHAPFGF